MVRGLTKDETLIFDMLEDGFGTFDGLNRFLKWDRARLKDALLGLEKKDKIVNVGGRYMHASYYEEEYESPNPTNSLTYEDLKEAIEGEGWAIGDYKDLLAKAETPEERAVIKHILKEEEEHLDELWVLVKKLGLLPIGESPACREMSMEEFREGYVDAYYPNLEGYAYQAEIIGPDEGREAMNIILKDVAWIEQCGNASPTLHMRDGSTRHVDSTDDFPTPTSEKW